MRLDQPYPFNRLLRGQHLAGDAGAAFVGAIEAPFAETALDITSWRHRQMNPAGFAVIAAKAGVFGFTFHFHHRAASGHDISPFKQKMALWVTTQSAIAFIIKKPCRTKSWSQGLFAFFVRTGNIIESGPEHSCLEHFLFVTIKHRVCQFAKPLKMGYW
jgi:hypothetical protein